jgi:hypothetical protein
VQFLWAGPTSPARVRFARRRRRSVRLPIDTAESVLRPLQQLHPIGMRLVRCAISVTEGRLFGRLRPYACVQAVLYVEDYSQFARAAVVLADQNVTPNTQDATDLRTHINTNTPAQTRAHKQKQQTQQHTKEQRTTGIVRFDRPGLQWKEQSRGARGSAGAVQCRAVHTRRVVPL